MRRPPPIMEMTSVPVTSLLFVAAAAAMVGSLSGGDMDRFIMDARTFHGEPWRIITSTLLHGGLFHLVFNLYWLWVFGSLLEKNIGSLLTGTIYLYLAVVSALAEWTFLEGGIGLSGVGYGLFGILWVLGRIDPRFTEAVDRQTVVLFVGWFFFCIVATITKLMAIANIAHAAGAIAGVVCGLVFIKNTTRRLLAFFGTTLLLALVLIGSTLGRPALNFSSSAGQDSAWFGYQALGENRNTQAAMWYKEAVNMNAQEPKWWYNLGVAYSRIAAEIQDKNNHIPFTQKAYRCYARALTLKPDSELYKKAKEETKAYLVSRNAYQGNLEAPDRALDD